MRWTALPCTARRQHIDDGRTLGQMLWQILWLLSGSGSCCSNPSSYISPKPSPHLLATDSFRCDRKTGFRPRHVLLHTAPARLHFESGHRRRQRSTNKMSSLPKTIYTPALRHAPKGKVLPAAPTPQPTQCNTLMSTRGAQASQPHLTQHRYMEQHQQMYPPISTNLNTRPLT